MHHAPSSTMTPVHSDTPSTVEMIRWGFRFVLGRDVDDPAVLQQCLAVYPTFGTLRDALLTAPEFHALLGAHQHQVPLLGAVERELLARLDLSPGEGEPGFFKDFLGVRTRLDFLPRGHDWLDGIVIPVPAAGLTKFHDPQEWAALLRAAAEAAPRGSFTLMELGAGWGPWVSAGARLAQALRLPAPRLIALEADAGHLDFLRTHFADNGLDLSNTRIIHGIVGPEDGEAFFPVLADSASDYGASASFEAVAETRPMHRLPCHALSRLLREEPILDLLHCDIQGAEGETLPAAMEALNARVRRVMVGTHSRGVEHTLADAFGAAGWLLEDDLACMQGHAYGPDKPPVLMADGVQVWRNPSYLSLGVPG